MLNRNTPLDKPQIYRVKQLRPDGVHCQESAGTGPVNLKIVVPVMGAAILQVTMDQLMCAALFLHPLGTIMHHHVMAMAMAGSERKGCGCGYYITNWQHKRG